MIKKIVVSVFIFLSCTATAQVKIGNNITNINNSSLLELESTTKGVLFPRVALTSTTTFAPLQAHVIGMTVYNTATTGNVTPGMYTNDGFKWVKLGSESINQNVVDLISNQTIAGNKTFIGVPIAPTAELGTNSTQLATTEFVNIVNTINANLSGPITSIGNATSVTSQTGTGSKFVMDTAPILVLPVLGVATATSINETAIPISKILVVTTDKLNVLAPTTSTELATVITDETGSGKLVLSESATSTGTSIFDKVAIGTSLPASSSLLELSSDNKGMLVPRMCLSQRDAIIDPVQALLIYNTTDGEFNYYQSGWKDFSPSFSSVNSVTEINTTSLSDIVIPGMTFSPKKGSYLVEFNAQYTLIPVDVTSQGASDLTNTVATIMAYPTTATHALTFTDGEIVTAGVYQIAGAASIAGTITLSGSSSAIFIFKITGAFNTGASVKVLLSGGVLAANIFWISDGAVGLGAGTQMKGTMISRGAAISAGANSIIDGRMFSTIGAIGFGPGTASIPQDNSLVNLGILSTFSMFTSNGGIGNTGISTITGDIGTNLGAVTGFGTPANGSVNGTIYTPGMQSAVATFSIYQNGVAIPNSVRSRSSDLNTVDVSLQSIGTINSGQSLDVRWNVTRGTLKIKNRIFSIIKLQ